MSVAFGLALLPTATVAQQPATGSIAGVLVVPDGAAPPPAEILLGHSVYSEDGRMGFGPTTEGAFGLVDSIPLAETSTAHSRPWSLKFVRTDRRGEYRFTGIHPGQY